MFFTDTCYNAADSHLSRAAALDAPIGIFDSGMGGLTVARAIHDLLPHESIFYVGDTKRCPYGVRTAEEICVFVRQIGAWLSTRAVKLVVIACNTATAAALPLAQKTFGVPVIGVIDPGARAAIQTSINRHVGVIATPLTIQSDSYARAISQLDAAVQVFSLATPRFVPIVEAELASGAHFNQDWMDTPGVCCDDATCEMVAEDLAPLVKSDIDTLVLGCTHFPLLAHAIRQAFGRPINLVSSSQETAREVAQTLQRRDQLNDARAVPRHRFATTGDDITAFAAAGRFIFGHPLASIEYIDLAELETLAPRHSTAAPRP